MTKYIELRTMHGTRVPGGGAVHSINSGLMHCNMIGDKIDRRAQTERPP
jgi:hypothetical protein